MDVESEDKQFQVVDSIENKHIHVKDFSLTFEEVKSIVWHVPGQEIVVHRPLLTGTLTANGRDIAVKGYSKRFNGH